MKSARLLLMLSFAVALGGCANRLSATTETLAPGVAVTPDGAHDNDYGYVVVRTTSRPVTTARSAPPKTYPAPPPPASVQLVRGPQTLHAAHRVVIAPRRAPARVQPALSVPPVRKAPRKVQPAPAPAPCTEGVLFTPQKDCVFDPCDPCAGGRCSVPK